MAQLSGQGGIGHHGATTDSHTSARNKVGARAFDTAGNEYRYVKYTAANSVGGWAVVDGSWNATRVTTTSRGAVGIAQTTHLVDEFGWLKVYGIEDVAQIGDSEATSAYGLLAPSGATTEPTMGVTSSMLTSVVSGAINNPLVGAFIKAAASTATTASSSSHSGVTVQVYLNYPMLSGLTVERHGST